MERYEAYKDSGVEWIGEMPAGWKTARLKNVAQILRGGSPRPIEDYIAETGDPNSFNWIKIGDTDKYDKYIRKCRQKIISDGCSKSRAVHKGDLLLTNSMSFGRPYILDLDGYIHDGWVCFASIKSVSPEYLYYCLLSECCAHQFVLMVDGGVVKNLNVDKIGSATIVLPSLKEQDAIVIYLDAKTAEIDTLVADCEREVELLQEYRKAVISEAVTKGLDPDAPMKDSGIEWLGETPEGWGLPRLGMLLSGMKDGTHSTHARVDDGHPLLSAKNVRETNIVISDHESMIAEEDYQTIIACGYPRMGDVLLTTIGGSIGRAVVYSLAEVHAFQRSVMFLRPMRTLLDSRYLCYLLRSNLMQRQMFERAAASAQDGIYSGDIARYQAVLPPLLEQTAIADCLDAKTAEIDALIEAKQSMADKLREYRRSLISEAVTGKFKVPGV